MIGTQNPAESIFVIPQADGGPPIKLTGLYNLRDDEGSRVLLSAERHRHQVHRELGMRRDRIGGSGIFHAVFDQMVRGHPQRR